jgi:hypothetical protein
VRSQFAEGIKVLLDRGMPPMWMDSEGFTPVHYAACLPETSILELLVVLVFN